MAYRLSQSERLLRLAEDNRAAVVNAVDALGITPELRRLDDSSRALIAEIMAWNLDMLDAIYLHQQAMLSEWRTRQRREAGVIDPEAA